MSKVLFQAKVTLQGAADLGSNNWSVTVTFADALGVFTAGSVQVGDVMVFDTAGAGEFGTYTRYIIQSIDSVSGSTITCTVQYDPTNDNDTVPDLSWIIGLGDGLITRPTSQYNLLPTPATGVHSITDDFAEYVSNMNLTNIDGISGGGSTDLSAYSTTAEMNTAISTATADMATVTYVDQQVASVSAGAPDLTQSSVTDLGDVDTTSTAPTTGQALLWDGTNWVPGDTVADLTGYATESYVDTQIAAIPSTDLSAYSTTTEMNTAISTATADFVTSADVTAAIAADTDTVTTLVDNGDNTLTYTAEDGTQTVIDLSLYLDDTNLARLTSGTLDSGTGIATFTRDDATTFTVDFSALLSGGAVSYNDLADIPTNIAYVDTVNTFTAGQVVPTLDFKGVPMGGLDSEGVDIDTNDLIRWSKQALDENNVVVPNTYNYTAFIGMTNWSNDFFINGPVAGGGTKYSIRMPGTGDINFYSASSGGAPEAAIQSGNVQVYNNLTVDGVISGDGSGLTNLPQSDGFTYGTVKGVTTDDPTGNTFLGHEAGVYGSATQSVFLGLDAGRGKGSGSTQNVAIGYGSLVDGGTQSRQTAIGHMALRNAGFTGAAGSVTLMTQTEVDYLNSQAGNLNGVTIVPGGTGYTDGTYEVIATKQTNAGWNNVTEGSGLTLDVVTDGAGVITSITINNAGSGYRTNEAVIIDGGDGNAAVIISSLVNTVSSSSNVAVGFQAGVNAKSARNSVLIGNESGAYNWNGANNVFVGASAGREAFTINNSVAVGENAGSGSGGNGNTFLGNYAGQTVRGNNNIMLGAHAGKAYSDANNAIVIGTQGNIAAGQREGVIEIGNNNNTRLYVPGVGLDTKLFHDLDNTTDQFMYYDASNQQFRPMEISIDGIEVSNAENAVTNLNSTKLMGGPTTTVQHDVLAFGGKMGFDAFSAEGLRIDNDTWESTTFDKNLFVGKKDQSIYVTENDTTYTHTLIDGTLDNNPGGRSVVHKAWRVTIDSQGQLGYCSSKDIQIGVGYIPGGSQARVTIEYATTADLANWITAAESDTYFGAAYLNFSTINFGAYHGVRITIAPYQRFSNTNGYGTFHPDSEGVWPVINISSIKMMTSRPGTQGSGPERSFPYNWDADKNILPGGAVRAAYLSDPGVTEVPAYSFVHDTNTGIGKAGSNSDGTVSVITNGVERVRFGNDQDAGAISVIENDGRVRPVFHEGYMGPGTNLDADLLDNVQGADYISTKGWLSGIDVAGTKYLPKPTISDIPDLNGAIEQGGVYSPFWGSDLGNVFVRAGAYDAATNPNGYLVTGIGTLPDIDSLNAMVNAEGNYGSINADNFVTAGDTVVIEVPTSLQWSRPTVGITFGSNGTKADYLLVEVLQNGVWNTVSHWWDNGVKVYGALDSTSGKAINVQHSFVVPDATQQVTRIRYTIAENPGGNGIRVTHLFAYKYNSKGLSHNFLSNNGGTVYGDVTVNASFKQEWVYINTNSNTGINRKYMVDTGTGVITLTLPSAANFGDEIAIVDMGGVASTNNITVARNGHNIMGSADDLVINTNRTGLTLVYTNATHGWVLKDN